ncbi:hypothetical protein [Micromonospora coerulea]|uniref:hypothetical protein n=1 Tax=Micromonospora coerulea TaxID=47856 RepID=UPI0031F9FBD7
MVISSTNAIESPQRPLYKTELYPLLRRINYYLMRWVRKKFRRLKTFNKFHRRGKQVTNPRYFAHWKSVHSIW